MKRTIKYVPIDDVKRAEINPKRHDIPGIAASIRRLGFGEPPLHDGRTGRIVAGHGRTDALILLREQGYPAPEGVTVDKAGVWHEPVVYGWSSVSDADAAAYLIGSNRWPEVGGWDHAELLQLLDPLDPDELLPVTGYDPDDIVKFMARVHPEAPPEFPSFDEDTLTTEHVCPKCGYEF